MQTTLVKPVPWLASQGQFSELVCIFIAMHLSQDNFKIPEGIAPSFRCFTNKRDLSCNCQQPISEQSYLAEAACFVSVCSCIWGAMVWVIMVMH